ncbi:MAG: PASTA domain-containing protein, partial [Armatimonadota bacterium]
MLTGDLPFKGDNALQVALKHAQDPVPSPRAINIGIPRALDGVVQKALGKRPEERYLSAADMLADMREVRDALRYGKSLAWSPLDRGPAPVSAEIKPAAVATPMIPVPAAAVPAAPLAAVPAPSSYEEEESDATIVMPSTIRGASALEGRRGKGAPMPTTARSVRTDDEVDYLEPEGRRQGSRRNNGGNGSRWLTFINLFLGLALIGGIGGLGWMTMNFLQPTSEVVVPNLVGKTLTEAKTEAADKKFDIAIVDQQYMDKVPSDTVYQQKPEPGRRIRENKQVSLWVSRGPRMAAVPDVRDMSFDLARRVIEKNGLRVGNYTYEYDPLAARGNVLR